MKPEAQRVAIAEAYGITDIKPDPNGWGGGPDVKYVGVSTVPFIGWFVAEPKKPLYRGRLPDYLNDLNAMHEAEKVLTDYKQRCEYAKNLLRVTKVYDVIETHASDFNGTELDHDALFDLSHATAAQRAEAFLRTLNLWTP